MYSKFDQIGQMNWGEKLEKLIFLESKLQDESMKSKVTQFGYVFTEMLRCEIKRENSIAKREKRTKLYIIKLIY